MIKGLTNIKKEDKKLRAIDKLLGCTCEKRKETESIQIKMISDKYYLPFYSAPKKCPIHGWRRRQ